MSLESIKQIHQVEQEMQLKRTEALSQAKKIQADAERSGKELLDSTYKRVNEEVRRLLHNADLQAAENSKKILEETRISCTELAEQANDKLAAAATLIVERVVDI